MNLEIARPEDAAALAEFYKTFSLKGLVELKIDRAQNFFAPYAIQSDRFLTYQLKEENKIEGIASFVLRDVLFNGKVQPIAFGRDLRISQQRKAILEWSQHFLPVMEEVLSSFQCKHLFSILSMNEVAALNTFVRPRSRKRPLPNYHLYRRFNLVSIHGRLPWSKNPLPHLKIRRGSSENVDALIYYIIQKSLSKDLATVWDSQSFFEKLERWKGLKLEDFLVAFDNNENIVGCAAPWSAGGLQEMIPLQYSVRAHNFRQFLKFGKYFGWTRTLTKPYSRLKVEAGLNFKYLNFLFADNSDIFESLLWRAYEEAHENEFLVYNQQRSEYIYRRPLTWISAKTPFGIYLLLRPDEKPPEFLHPSHEKSVEMEPFFSL